MARIAHLAPAGFAVREAGRRTLLAREALLEPVLAAGLDDPSTWESLAAARPGGPGRGASGRLALPRSVRVVVKRMRRGGWAGPIWRDRFLGSARLLRNLSVPLEAMRRGVPTAAPAAMLIEEGPPGLRRAWLAVEEIEGAEDLLTRLSGPSGLSEGELRAALRAVKGMHDRGVEHRDLNLGNLLVRSGDAGLPEAFVVDLDRARLHGAALPVRKRRAALLRMERSYLKRFGDEGRLSDSRARAWAAAYAGDDRDLAAILAAPSVLERASLAIHRLGWRRER